MSHNKHGVRFQISPNRTVETSQNVPSFSQTLENSGVSVSLEDYYSPDTSPKVSIKTKGTPYVKKINYNESSESSSILSCTSRQVSPAARQSYKGNLRLLPFYLSLNKPFCFRFECGIRFVKR